MTGVVGRGVAGLLESRAKPACLQLRACGRRAVPVRNVSVNGQLPFAYGARAPPPGPLPSHQAAGMADLGEHWRGFVCLEVAQARSGPAVLQPGEAWEGGTTVQYDTIGEGAD